MNNNNNNKKELLKKIFRFFSYFDFSLFFLVIDFHENKVEYAKSIFIRDLTVNINNYRKGMEKGIDLKFSGGLCIRNIKL